VTDTLSSDHNRGAATLQKANITRDVAVRNAGHKVRLLHVINSMNPRFGGPVEVIDQISRIHLTQGHEVEVVTLDRPHDPWVKKSSPRVHALGPGRGRYGFSSRLVPWLRSRASEFDAVVVHGLWQYHSFAVWRALRRRDVPYFVFAHGMLDPWFKRTYPLKHLKKWLYWPWAGYRVLRDASAVCFTCEEERLLARQSFWLYRCNERVIAFGTAAPQGDPETQKQLFFELYPEMLGKRSVLFLGRIHPKKGCDLLIRAFAKLLREFPASGCDSEPLHLVIAGPDQAGWSAHLQALAASLGISQRITWTGMLSGDPKFGALRSAEVFALPSHQENFGIAVAEALACGVPVLISNKVNIWREIERDGAGLVATDDEEGTLRSLRGWFSKERVEQQTFRDRAYKCFADRFEIHKAADSLVKVLVSGGSR
jgi:glycosyltransferase involved in cell wall biosynthesis